MLDTLLSGGSLNESKCETGRVMIGRYLVCVYIENGRYHVKLLFIIYIEIQLEIYNSKCRLVVKGLDACKNIVHL